LPRVGTCGVYNKEAAGAAPRVSAPFLALLRMLAPQAMRVRGEGLRGWCSLIALLAAACGSPACGSSASGAGEPRAVSGPSERVASAEVKAEPRVVLLPAGADPVTVRVEVARREEERRRGLMFRTHLDEDAGMLFLFERPQQLTFWMRNTDIPLDIIFIEPSMRILGIVENTEPRTDASRSVPGESQYVLEVNAGFSRRHGLTSGTSLRFEGVTLRP
jgi:uncharacterized protein